MNYKRFFLVLAIVFSSSIFSFADGPGGPGGGPNGNGSPVNSGGTPINGAPIDGGLSMFLLLSAAYGIKKKTKKSSAISDAGFDV